jgi:putative radical SAM enzyme (TIGR03279 family)
MTATISFINENGPADKLGLHKGDIIKSINGNPVDDVIDYMFYSRDGSMDLRIQRGSKVHSYKIKKNQFTEPGFEIRPFRIKSCRNKCIFCFVHQLPKGMRKSLYIRDDDYRMSFLYGNYITLTNLSRKDKDRIYTQRLSPLYVSVHTTDDGLRRKMIGNPKAPPILQEIFELTSNRIRLHVQIVVIPGMNDGKELEQTIKDLEKFYPYVSSIAVVPVGITKQRRSKIRAIEKKDAHQIIDSLKKTRARLKRRHGEHLVHIADEFYIKAGIPFPAYKEYGDFPQLENGVGLVPSFLQSSKKLRLPKKVQPKKIALFTGASFMPYLQEFTTRLQSIEGLTLDLFKVENSFFGPSVTVTGLLTGKDVLKAVLGKTKADCLLVPDVVLKSGEDVFLDNVTLKDLEENLGMQVKAIEPTPEALLKEIKDGCERND